MQVTSLFLIHKVLIYDQLICNLIFLLLRFEVSQYLYQQIQLFLDQNRLNLIESPILNNPYEKSSHSTSLVVAPNPVVNDTMIQFSSPMWMRGQLQIHDLQGRIIQELIADFSSGTNQIPLNLSHLANGLYVLTVLDDKNKTMASTKFRKQ